MSVKFQWMVDYLRNYFINAVGMLIVMLIPVLWKLLGWILKGALGNRINMEVQMLEGKELDGKIGNFGEYSLDIDDKFVATVSLSAKIDLFAEAVKLAKKTNTQIDDKFLEIFGSLLGRDKAELAAIAAAI